MAGTSNITGQESVLFADNASFDGTTRDGRMQLDGQLWIGSSIAPHVRLNTLTEGAGISIVNGDGTITIGLAGGGSAVETLTGNSGIATPIANNINVKTANATVTFVGSAGNLLQDFNGVNIVLGSSLPVLAGGVGNVGLGINVMQTITSGSQNTAMGNNALAAITTGNTNVAIGRQAGLALTTGSSNSLFGTATGASLTTSQNNAAFGGGALAFFTSGAATAGSNVAIGVTALANVVTGTFNTAVGRSAGANYTTSESSNICISNAGTITESNTIRIGTSGTGDGQQNRCFIVGIDGVNVGSVAKVVTVAPLATDQLGTATITAGAGISVTPTANTITIASIGGQPTASFDVQANTAPGTDPVVPTALGVVTVNGAAVANHSVVIETHSRAANAYNVEVQYSAAAAATDATKSGVAHFNSGQFTVDSNGFVSSIGGGLTWSVITGATQAMAVNHGYIANRASNIAFTLPTVSAVGDIIEVTGMNTALGWTVSWTTNQQVFFGNAVTTVTSGTLSSSATRDSIRMVCIVANLTWNVISSVGNITCT